MRKFICLIFIILFSLNTYSQSNDLGFVVRYGYTNFSGIWGGAGLHYSRYINESGSIRLSFIMDIYNLASDNPFEISSSMNHSELRAHYFYHISDQPFYLGLGILYAWHNLRSGHPNGYIARETISDTWGIDIAAGVNIGKAFNIELDYTFKYPDLIQEKERSWNEPVEEKVSGINFNTLYLNLLFYFSF